ncbi:MAG: hypothetical protein ABW252_23920 [Polyangiales bacterium]
MLLALSFVRATAHADAATDDQRARAHFIAGESHFAAGRWADAVREFTLAYELSQRQEMLINRSRAYERNEQLEEARGDLRLLLERHPETRYREEAEARLERLARAMRARPAPASPEERDDAPVSPPPPAPLPAVAAEVEPAAPAEAPARVVRTSKRPSWPVIALGSGAVALGAIALGTGLKAHALHGDLEKGCGASGCPRALIDDRDRGHTLAKVSTGLTFGALALVGGAVGLYVFQLRRRPERVDVALDARPQHAEARLKVRF